MAQPFFTIGHASRSLDEFIALLRESQVACLIDIRKLPGSRAHPQFNESGLSAALAAQGLAYLHLAALGGLRGKTPGVPPERNGLWRNASFHRYADYAGTPAFHAGLEQVLALGQHKRCALMCAEVVWWRCHRRIVADHLLARGETVFHIMGRGRVEPARLTAGAVVGEGGAVSYPPAP
ncbi:MAG: DUF488 domain-containing protein [Proteobacteria bacterium]|nr:DUF488 domain-containing protein [Pseudomonadota bacterium]